MPILGSFILRRWYQISIISGLVCEKIQKYPSSLIYFNYVWITDALITLRPASLLHVYICIYMNSELKSRWLLCFPWKTFCNLMPLEIFHLSSNDLIILFVYFFHWNTWNSNWFCLINSEGVVPMVLCQKRNKWIYQVFF